MDLEHWQLLLYTGYVYLFRWREDDGIIQLIQLAKNSRMTLSASIEKVINSSIVAYNILVDVTLYLFVALLNGRYTIHDS